VYCFPLNNKEADIEIPHNQTRGTIKTQNPQNTVQLQEIERTGKYMYRIAKYNYQVIVTFM